MNFPPVRVIEATRCLNIGIVLVFFILGIARARISASNNPHRYLFVAGGA